MRKARKQRWLKWLHHTFLRRFTLFVPCHAPNYLMTTELKPTRSSQSMPCSACKANAPRRLIAFAEERSCSTKKLFFSLH